MKGEIQMNSIETIKEAITLKKAIIFEYNKEGKVKGDRIGNPHAIFIHISTRNITVDIYQIGGVTDGNDNFPKWGQFLIDHIENVRIINKNFDLADGYNPISPKYKELIIKAV